MESRTIALVGLRMRYRVSTGPVPPGRPPVVLVHGQVVVEFGVRHVRRAVGTFRYMLHHRIEDRLPAVAAPTRVLRGTRNAIVSPAWARRVADLLPNGRLVEVAGAARTMNFFAPERLARVVRVFLGLRRAAGTHPQRSCVLR